MNRTNLVNITKRVKLAKGWRFCKVAIGANNKLRPDWVIINGKEERHPEVGRYYLDFLERGRRRRIAAGGTAAEAQYAADKQERLMLAHKAAAAAGTVLQEPKPAAGGRSLREAVILYLLEIQAHKKPKTFSAYQTTLRYFLESCQKEILEEVTRADLLAFRTYLRHGSSDRKKQSDRSQWNKFANVMSFLKWAKITVNIGKNDWPSYTQEEVENYGQEELAKFFAACTQTERVWFKFFRFTGMREQEVMHVSWKDIDFERKVVTVRENKQFGWTPKANKGRDIPIPTSLLELLKAWKKKSDKTCGLVFPTSGCKPKLNFLDECKAIAERAGLNPDDFWLHKFRATRTTEWAREFDTDSAMRMSGHTDYESFKRYLAKQDIDVLQQQVEKMNMVGV